MAKPIEDSFLERDRLEDAIYASPLGSTTPWRCKECGTAIARLGQPCKCTPELLEPEKNNVLKAVELDRAASLSADKIKAALAHVHAREKRVENPQGMTRLEATRVTLQDFALNDAERGVLLRALNIEPSEL